MRNVHVTNDGSVLISGASRATDFPFTTWFPTDPKLSAGSHGFIALLRSDLSALIWGDGWSGSPLAESALSADQILYAIASSPAITPTVDAYGGPDALYQNYTSRLIAVDARSGRWLYASGTGRSNFYTDLVDRKSVV